MYDSQAPVDLPFRPRTMLSICTPQPPQDLQHLEPAGLPAPHPQQQQQQQIPIAPQQQQHFLPHPHAAPAYILQTSGNPSPPAMPHRVLEAQHLVRVPSEASSGTVSSAASTPPSSAASTVSAPTSAPAVTAGTSASDASVVQALEIARESPDGGHDPTISKILEGALASVWGKVQAQPDSYIMSRDEFSIFNYFQHRFTDNATARLARKLYWDNMSA